jgi:hypothetical protein
MFKRLLVPLVAGAILALLTAACGDDSIDQGTTAPRSDDPSGSVSSPPANPGGAPPTGAGGAAPIKSRNDLVGATPLEPESVVVDPANQRRLLVRFWGGVEPCFGVELRAVESANDVKVTVLGGAPPEGRDRACIALAKLYEATIDLKDPLGTRTIVVTK